MIDVPVEVKDALREGTYKKNYRFVVYKDVATIDYNDLATLSSQNPSYTLTEACDFNKMVVLHAPKAETAQTFRVWVKWPDNSRQPFTFNVGTVEDAYLEITYGILPVGTEIYITEGPQGGEIGLTTTDRIVTTTSEIIDSEIGTIDNNNLVSESVSIDERMCSGDTLKFGLCEGSSIEFQYFDKPNITGRKVQVFVDVQYRAGIMGHIDASGNFTAPANGSYTFEVKKGSATGLYITYAGGGDMYVDFVLGQTTDTEELEARDVVTLNNPSSDALFEVSTDMWHTIPMGFFDVKKCSRQASTGIIKATGYNKLQSEYLDEKANDLLLTEIDDPSIGLTLYSVRKALLKQFEITPYENIEQKANRYEENSTTLLTNSVKLSNLVSDSGPINYYQMQQWADTWSKTITTNSVLVLKVVSEGRKWTIPAGSGGYYQFIQAVHNFSVLSELFVSYLINFLDACPINKSGESIINEIKNNRFQIAGGGTIDGWQQLFGIIYQKNNQGKKYYNDYGYKYQNNGTYKVDGTANDFIMQLLTNEVEYTIEYRVPTYISVGLSASGAVYDLGAFGLLGSSPIPYVGEDFIGKYYPQFKYENGEYIPYRPYYYEEGPFDSWFKYCQVNGISQADLITVNPNTISDFTLRDITSAAYETVCQFGQLSRITDFFSGVELNHSRLYPVDSLYPATDLYPDGAAMSGFKSMYSKLWADEGNIHKWRYLIITYKGLDGEGNEKDYTLQRTINADGTDNYNMSDNWLFRNLIWTADQVAEYAEAMVAKMQDMTWFPFEMWCAGLPYIETGDEIEIPLNGESYTSYVLQRQLKGIQNLQDTYINGTLDIF